MMQCQYRAGGFWDGLLVGCLIPKTASHPKTGGGSTDMNRRASQGRKMAMGLQVTHALPLDAPELMTLVRIPTSVEEPASVVAGAKSLDPQLGRH